MYTLHQKITYFIDHLDDDSKFTQQFNYTISFDEDPTAPLHLPISSFEKHNVEQALGGAYDYEQPPVIAEYLCTLHNESVVKNVYRVAYDVAAHLYEAQTAAESVYVVRSKEGNELGINAFKIKSRYNPLNTTVLDSNGASLMQVIHYYLFEPEHGFGTLQNLIESPLLDEHLTQFRLLGY